MVSSVFNRHFSDRKDRENLLAIVLTMASVILSVFYGFIYQKIEDKIDNGTVQSLRGFLQVVTMGSLSFCLSDPFSPSKDTSASLKQQQDKVDEATAMSKWEAFKDKTSWKSRAIFLALLTSVVAGIRVAFIFQALQATGLGSVHAIWQGSPLVVMICAHFFLGDRLTPLRIFAALLLVVGIVLNAMPKDVNNLTSEVISNAILEFHIFLGIHSTSYFF